MKGHHPSRPETGEHRADQGRQRQGLESAGDARLEIDDAIAAGAIDTASSSSAEHREAWIGATIAALMFGAIAGAWVVSH